MHEELDGQRLAVWALVGLIGVLSVVTIVLAYATGLLTTLGYASAKEDLQGIGHGRFGWIERIGLSTFYAPQGWKFYVDYEVDARAGSLQLWLHEPWVPVGRKVSEFQRISGKGSGRVMFEIPRSSFYGFQYEGSVLGGRPDKTGYDIAYSITWGLMPP